MNRKKFLSFFLICLLALPFCSYALNVEKLPDEDIAMVKQVIAKLQPLIREHDSKETLATLTFAELYKPLTKKEKKFLKQFQGLTKEGTGVKIPFLGLSTGEKGLVMIKGQKVKEKVRKTGKDGKVTTELIPRVLPPQYLPKPVYEKYVEMMDAMEKDIGKRLYLESGYRSSAFQLYLLVYYLQNHAYSIRETAKFVALPGFSEHGCPRLQALDFINEDGVNGDPNVAEFEALPENRWLLEHAREFGFVLSYPKRSSTGITYEPWHWRYDPAFEKKLSRSTSRGGSKRIENAKTKAASGSPHSTCKSCGNP